MVVAKLQQTKEKKRQLGREYLRGEGNCRVESNKAYHLTACDAEATVARYFGISLIFCLSLCTQIEK